MSLIEFYLDNKCADFFDFSLNVMGQDPTTKQLDLGPVLNEERRWRMRKGVACNIFFFLP